MTPILPLRRVGRLLLLIGALLLVSSPPGRARAPRRYQLGSPEKPVALLPAGAATYLVTEHSVYQFRGRQVVRRYRSEAPIQCALAADTALWLGTARGAVQLSTQQFRPRPLALPEGAGAASVVGLCRDAAGAIWVGAVGYGVFRGQRGAFEKVLSVPSVNAALVTADSSVWIASNLGLSRFQHQQWTRYNEEGVANREIPDNIVEKLLPDNAGNLWVLMSAGISVFPGGGAGAAPAELPTATFIGQPGNEVFSVVYLPGLGRVFATAMGPLLLPDVPAGQFASFEPATTDKVEEKRALIPLHLPGATQPRLVQVDQRQRVWVVGESGVQVYGARAFRQLVRAGQAQKRG
ncbi:hypothetical protein [uncultured Hymenobacter sp.]|uniref:hypothetical protein n=1 Tax=uncultured Hymenobacter sp. TaxID=170016 RepID=UPI0035CAA640